MKEKIIGALIYGAVMILWGLIFGLFLGGLITHNILAVAIAGLGGTFLMSLYCDL